MTMTTTTTTTTPPQPLRNSTHPTRFADPQQKSPSPSLSLSLSPFDHRKSDISVRWRFHSATAMEEPRIPSLPFSLRDPRNGVLRSACRFVAFASRQRPPPVHAIKSLSNLVPLPPPPLHWRLIGYSPRRGTCRLCAMKSQSKNSTRKKQRASRIPPIQSRNLSLIGRTKQQFYNIYTKP